MSFPDILLIMSGLLVLSMMADSICRHLPIPYTVLLVILGLAVNYFANDVQILNLHHFSQFHLTSELVLFIFLPALVFESALSLDARALLKNIVPILMLAIIGMLVSVALVGFGVWWSLGLPLVVALLFASLISATDPVAVIALFKELGVSRRLNVLVEGESLMNDATAIVLFNILMMLLLEDQFSFANGLQAVEEFFKVFFGGILVGVFTGIVVSELLVRLYHGNQSIPVVLSLVLAYFSFIFAEHELHVSGVMSVLSAAITLNIAGLSRLSKQTIDYIHVTWQFMVLICNSLLFIMIGLSVNLVQLADFWPAILLAVFAVYIARAVSVYVLIPLTTRSFSLTRISWPERHIMWWGGLKGGLAIAIVMSIPETMPEKPLLVSLTLGVVLVYLLVNAPTIHWLMHFLKMDLLNQSEQAELNQTMQQATQSVNKVLHQFATLHLMDSTMESSLESKLHRTLDLAQVSLSDQQLLRNAHLQALQAETDEIEYLYEIGMVNYYTLVTFKDILRVDREHSIDYLNAQGNDWLQPSILLDFERFIIHTLSEKEWTQGLLTQYQRRRFANKILHDIAGVLMAHKGLKVIKQMINDGLDAELIKPIQQGYQKRLKRRQNRLHYFSENYPFFYQRYEAFVFQKVALRYSLQLVQKSHEQGMISAKVLQLISHKLTDSLEQVSFFKMSLPIVKRHAWLNRVPLFENLPVDFLKKMGQEAAYVNFLPGDTVFYQGDVGDSLYILLSGQVKIWIANEAGENQLVASRGEGALIGIRALLKNSNRSATVEAKTYVTCLRLSAKNILQFSIENEVLGERLQKMGLLKKIMDQQQQIEEFFAEDGKLAKVIPGYLPRVAQVEMAKAIAQSIENKEHVIVEAGTGTGKTFAYLVPAILSGKKVIVSTGTKNLQDQLFNKDVPLIRTAMTVPFAAALLKGRANYLCTYRLELAIHSNLGFSREEAADLANIKKWSKSTRTGDISDMPDVMESNPIWGQATSTRENCIGQECPEHAECFLMKARKKAQDAHLIVVNHHLLCADWSIRETGFGELLPNADVVIIDEAHQLADTASNFLGMSLGSKQLSDLAKDALMEYFQDAKDMPDLRVACENLEHEIKDMRLAFGLDMTRGDWKDIEANPKIMDGLKRLQQHLDSLADQLELASVRTKGLESCFKRAEELEQQFKNILQDSSGKWVRWYETHKKSFTLNLTPLDIAAEFKTFMAQHSASWVFTSATLSVAHKFDHFAKSLGISDPKSYSWESPFDFPNQSLFYHPKGLPQPNSPEFVEEIVKVAIPVINASKGRTFFLFTSHRALQAAAKILDKQIKYPILVQGDKPKAILLDDFKQKGNAVLLGTASFWEGIDVRGDALSTVIIDKLPFSSPGDPVLKARLEAMEKQGRKPFIEYQLPTAVIALRQGIGRLIRDVNDRGVLLLCDPRLLKKSYGHMFLNSVPAMRRTRDIKDVEAFFAEQEQTQTLDV